MTTVTQIDIDREKLAREVWPEEIQKNGLQPFESHALGGLYADLRMRRAKKGVFLFGTPGTGKTTAMRFLSNRFKIPWFSIQSTIADYMSYDGDDWYRWFCVNFGTRDIIIDDLGAEREVKRFGNESIVCDMISHREEMFQKHGRLTHFTSNLMGEDGIRDEKGNVTMMGIRDRYGDRILSRILGMCEVVMLTGPDRRRTC